MLRSEHRECKCPEKNVKKTGEKNIQNKTKSEWHKDLVSSCEYIASLLCKRNALWLGPDSRRRHVPMPHVVSVHLSGNICHPMERTNFKKCFYIHVFSKHFFEMLGSAWQVDATITDRSLVTIRQYLQSNCQDASSRDAMKKERKQNSKNGRLQLW